MGELPKRIRVAVKTCPNCKAEGMEKIDEPLPDGTMSFYEFCHECWSSIVSYKDAE